MYFNTKNSGHFCESIIAFQYILEVKGLIDLYSSGLVCGDISLCKGGSEVYLEHQKVTSKDVSFYYFKRFLLTFHSNFYAKIFIKY